MPQAEFEFEFVTPPGVTALANAREAGEPAAAPGGLVRHTYERTPAMSTYLVAVGILSCHHIIDLECMWLFACGHLVQNRLPR